MSYLYEVLRSIVNQGSSSSCVISTLCAPNFEFQFVSEAGLTHAVQYNTNLVAGTGWQTCTNIAGDGTLKSVAIPLATFTRSGQAFVRVATQ